MFSLPFVIRISMKRTEPVHPEKLIRDYFTAYAEKGGEIPCEVMNLSERMKSVENVQVVKEDFKQLMKEKVTNSL